MTFLELFAGVGGFGLALERVGMHCAGQIEIDEDAQDILGRRFPHAPRRSDVREWSSYGLQSVDLLVGGFPCQDLSVAGQRRGLAGERSGLFFTLLDIAKSIRPTWGLFENVPGLFSSHGGRDMATVLEGLRQCWPVVGYAVLDSQYFGVPQRRRRVFLVGGPTEDSVAKILFEPQSGRRDFAPSREAGADLAASLRSRSAKPGINPPGRGGEDDMNIVAFTQNQRNEVRELYRAGCLSAQPGMKQQTYVAALTNLGSGGPDDNEAQAGHLVPIAEVGAKTQMGAGRNGCGIGNEGDPMFTLQAGKQHAVGVRRLTPTECERLQGFPDGWTCRCMPIESYDSERCTCSDGPRYRMLGNAVTENVIRHLGTMILDVERGMRRR